jgi:hypothetical protein
MLELSDKELKTADIARSLNMRYDDVQALCRTAVSTLAYVDKRISERSACVEEPTKTVVERPGRKAIWTLSGDNKDGEVKIPKEKTYENNKSPLSKEVWELIHGIGESESPDKIEKPQKKTN